jgi:chaperonin GroES
MNLEEILSYGNVAEGLDKEQLDAIGRMVLDHYDTDQGSRSDWEEAYLKALDMAGQKIEAKNKPWKGAANIKYPLLTNACLQFNARVVPALIPNAEPVGAGFVGVDPDGQKQQLAKMVARHMNYQLMTEMTEWESEMDTMLMSIALSGTEFKKTYYDKVKRRIVSRHISPINLVVNYYATDLSTTRKTEIHRWNKNQLTERVRSGSFLAPDWEALGDALINEDPEISREGRDRMGYSEPGNSDSATPYTVLEYHGWYDLDEDGYEEPYIISVIEQTGEVVQMVPRFGEESVLFTEEREVVAIEPYESYTKYTFLPNPDGGFYGLGFGNILYPINAVVNTAINMMLDAGAMSNSVGGFIGRNVNMKGGMLAMGPGRWINVNASGDDLRKGIVPAPAKEPSQILLNLMTYMVEAGEKISSTTDIFSGVHPGQNSKTGVTQAVRDEGQKVFTAIYKRLRKSLKTELDKVYALNGLILAVPEGANSMVAASAQAFQVQVEHYSPDSMIIQPTADPTIAIKEQKMEKDNQVFQSVIATGLGNPVEAFRRLLDTMDVENIPAILPEDQPTPAQQQSEAQAQQADFEMKLKLAAAQLEEDKLNHQMQIDEFDRRIKILELSGKADELSVRALVEADKINKDILALGVKNDRGDKVPHAGAADGGRAGELEEQQNR